MNAFLEARVVNGRVVELNSNAGLPMSSMFPTLGWMDVSTVTVAGQPVAVGDAEASGAFSAPPAPSGPTPEQAYAALVAGGLTITSTGTPALNGVYPIDPDSQASIGVEAQFITTFSEFTNGTTTGLQWQLLNGSWVTFPTTASFLAFAKAAGQTVAAAKLAAATSAAMPSTSVTIA